MATHGHSFFYRGYLARLAQEDGGATALPPKQASRQQKGWWRDGWEEADVRLVADPKYRGGDLGVRTPKK